MTTPAKIAANRKNARRSTGPKTTRGKAKSSTNAMRHGLLSKHIALPDEDPGAFARFSEGVAASLVPHGQLEELLAERVIANAWRLRRVYRLESGMFAYQMLDARAEHERSKATRGDLALPDETDQRLHADEYDRAMTAVEKAETERDADHGVAAVVRDATGADMLSKLSRYETTLERGLYRALHELQRLQAARSGQAVLAPAVVDVDVSTSRT